MEQLDPEVAGSQFEAGHLALLQSVSVPLQWLDAEGRILWANDAALHLFAYSQAEYVGRCISDCLVDSDAALAIVQDVAADRAVQDREVRFRRSDGAIVPVAMSTGARGGALNHTPCWIRDLTDQKRIDTRLSVQVAVSRLLVHGSDPDDTAREMLRVISEHLDFTASVWWKSGADPSRLECVAEWHKSAQVTEAVLAERAVALNAAIWLSDLPAEANLVRTGIAIPLGDAFGVMEFFSDDQRVLDEQLLDVLSGLGRDFGRFLARARTERALQTRADHLQVLYDMTTEVNAAVSLDHIYRHSLATLERLLGVQRSSVLLFDSQGVMRFRHWQGLSDEYRAAVEGHSPWPPDARNPEPLIVNDVSASADLAAFRQIFEKEQIAALAFIPLVSRGRLIGKFMLYYASRHAFVDSEVSLAQAIASHIAIAIERRAAETANQENETRLSLALHAANIGVWEWDIERNRVVWSDRVYEIHGLSPGSMSGVPAEISQYFHPEDRTRVRDTVSEAMRTRGSYQLEFRILRPSGEVRWIATSGQVVCGEDGEPTRLIGTTVDITERKHAEAELLESAETIEALLESASQAILSVDQDGSIVTCNATAERMFGYARDELIGAPVEMLVPQRLRQQHTSLRHIFGAAPSSRPMGAGRDLTAVRRDGSEFPVEISLSSISTSNGPRAVSFISDISARQTAQMELRESEVRYRALFENSNDALAVSADGIFEYANPAYARMFGYDKPADVVGLSIYDTVPAHVHDQIRDSRNQRKAGGSRESMLYQSVGLRRDGTTFASEVRATDFWMGGRLYTLAILRDITAECEAEEALTRQAQELARSNADLQQFAYATSHDLQEPLRNITNFAQLLERRYDGKLDAQADFFIDTIVSGCRRMDSLIRDLLAFSRVANTEAAAPAAVDMNRAVRWALNNLEAQVRETGAEILFDNLPPVSGDQVQIVQLLQNLLSNAMKYRRERPTIEITASEAGAHGTYAIRDNGIGIASQYYDRVFGLFKRLHGREIPGTGVGLAICRRIVEKHGGTIWLESEPGVGTTFFFTLPLA